MLAVSSTSWRGLSFVNPRETWALKMMSLVISRWLHMHTAPSHIGDQMGNHTGITLQQFARKWLLVCPSMWYITVAWCGHRNMPKTGLWMWGFTTDITQKQKHPLTLLFFTMLCCCVRVVRKARPASTGEVIEHPVLCSSWLWMQPPPHTGTITKSKQFQWTISTILSLISSTVLQPTAVTFQHTPLTTSDRLSGDILWHHYTVSIRTSCLGNRPNTKPETYDQQAVAELS